MFTPMANKANIVVAVVVIVTFNQNERPIRELTGNFKKIVQKSGFDARRETHHCHRSVSFTY